MEMSEEELMTVKTIDANGSSRQKAASLGFPLQISTAGGNCVGK